MFYFFVSSNYAFLLETNMILLKASDIAYGRKLSFFLEVI